jgi:hypothetical protein
LEFITAKDLRLRRLHLVRPACLLKGLHPTLESCWRAESLTVSPTKTAAQSLPTHRLPVHHPYERSGPAVVPVGLKRSGCLNRPSTLQAISNQRRGRRNMHCSLDVRGWQPSSTVDLRYLNIHRSLGGLPCQRKSLAAHDRHSEYRDESCGPMPCLRYVSHLRHMKHFNIEIYSL